MTMSGMTPACSRCVAHEAELATLKVEVARLADAVAKALKNSGNSSKRPSGDIVKPPRGIDQAGHKKKRKRGGQPGHPRHQRPRFEASQVDKVKEYKLSGCPHCGGPVELSAEAPRVQQQVEIESAPIIVTEHRGQAYWCPNCQKLHYASLPKPVREAGLLGPRLYTLVAYLKGNCHCSFSTIRKFLRDVVKVQVSLLRTTLKRLQIFSVLRQSQPHRLIDDAGNRAICGRRLKAESPVKRTIKIHSGSF